MNTFVPADRANRQLVEIVHLEEFFESLVESDQPYFAQFGGYEICVTTPRYHTFAKNRRCSCCGMEGTRLFVEENTEFGGQYLVNFYAEVGRENSFDTYLNLMVADHIDPRHKGEFETTLQAAVANQQTLCYHCHTLRTNLGYCELETIRPLLFPAYRAYRSNIIRNKAKEKLERHYFFLKKNINTVAAIDANLGKANPDNQAKMKQKQIEAGDTARRLELAINEYEKTAQVSGAVPELLPVI